MRSRPPAHPRGEHGRQGRFEGWIQRTQLAGDFLAHPHLVVLCLDLKVGFEEIPNGVIGDRFAVGGRLAFEQEPTLGTRGTEELVEEAGLPHPRLPHNGHELAVASTGQLMGLAHGLELHLSPHEAREYTGRKRLQARPGRPGTHQLKDLQRKHQPLDRDRAERFDLDHPLGQPESLRRQEDAPRSRELLHAGRQMRVSGQSLNSPCGGHCQ